ncbi:MAG: hypothetical protein HYX72_07165 [Acidobacteria bacterium]|nr:hypothetical protein [Acidobacteriota bacterium]
MAHPQIAAFARLANGNAKPTRSIAGQNSAITRTIHDMAYNPITDEIVIPQFYAQAIMTYRGGANGDEKPIRIIMGPDTQMTTPARLALDPIHKEVFIPLEDTILVFPSDAEGNVKPIRTIKGPDTMLGATALTVDPVNNLLIASGQRPRKGDERAVESGRNGHILIFNRTDNGNVKPKAQIFGPKSKILLTALITVYPPTKMILAGMPSREKSSPNNWVGVWSETDNGDVPPRWMIGGPNQMLRQVRGITVVPKTKEVIVSDKYVNAVMTYHFPEIF